MAEEMQANAMMKSELIERIARKQSHLAYKDVELAVKSMLEQMSNSLSSGERIEIRGFGSFPYTTVRHVPGVILKRAVRFRYRVNTYHISNLARSYVSESTNRCKKKQGNKY